MLKQAENVIEMGRKRERERGMKKERERERETRLCVGLVFVTF
jgi:hypothetical protein